MLNLGLHWHRIKLESEENDRGIHIWPQAKRVKKKKNKKITAHMYQVLSIRYFNLRAKLKFPPTIMTRANGILYKFKTCPTIISWFGVIPLIAKLKESLINYVCVWLLHMIISFVPLPVWSSPTNSKLRQVPKLIYRFKI